MKFTVNKKTFTDAIKNVSSVIKNNTALPVLQNVLLRADDFDNNKIHLVADNLEQRISVTIEADIQESGSITLPAKKLLSVISKTNCGEIEISTNDNYHADLKCGTAKIKIFGIKPEDFPDSPKDSFIDTVMISSSALNDLLKKGGYCFSPSDARKVLSGICLEISGGEIHAVSTDGRRLAMAKALLSNSSHPTKQYIIPVAATNLLNAITSKNIILRMGTKSLSITSDNIVICSKLIEGAFPNWRQVIPQKSNNNIKINSGVFLSRIDLVSSMTSDTPSVELKFSSDQLFFECQSAESGHISDSMELENSVVNDLQFKLNPLYCQAAVKAGGVEEFVFSVNKPFSPMLLNFGDDACAVIMPIRSK